MLSGFWKSQQMGLIPKFWRITFYYTVEFSLGCQMIETFLIFIETISETTSMFEWL